MPLANPVNDANAMGNLLGQAGFTVSTQLNSTKAEMLTAIAQFSRDVSKTQTKLVVLYYAGHGAQLDWRNYLLPVDAVANNSEQLRQSCIDLNLLMTQLGAAKDKTFVIVLDACRNNPFGSAYQPEQKGLSQFDAPEGSLLAYATSPGSVASDGSGLNGLYTENLVRELSVRTTRIEDALKRVRLNVRLASKGAQIPWETTSLESDIYLFKDSAKKLTEAEQERELEIELGEWARIKSSREVQDWANYLRNYPNGRFAEIAQTRLTRLLASTEKPAAAMSTAAVGASASSAAPQSSPPSVTIELAPGRPVPALFQASANPYSAGRYPLGRHFSLGDSASYQVSDMMTGVRIKAHTQTVTAVGLEEDRVVLNNGQLILDSMGNALSTRHGGSTEVPQQITPSEFYIGKTWQANWQQFEPDRGETSINLALRIAELDTVRVPAGEFQAFRIEINGMQSRDDRQTSLTYRIWLVPGLNFMVKAEYLARGKHNKIKRSERRELVSLRQRIVDVSRAVLAAT
jgi:uncharacterized caspase-like protein